MMRYLKKYYKTAVVLLLCIILMTGCANDGNTSKITGEQNSVDKALNDQMAEQSGDSESGKYESETEPAGMTNKEILDKETSDSTQENNTAEETDITHLIMNRLLSTISTV